MTDSIEQTNNLLGVISKLVVGAGATIVFAYCFFDINYFPSGLSLGDSLLFIFAAIGFGIFYVIWLLFGFVCVYGLVYPFSSKLGKTDSLFERIIMGLAGVLILVFFLLLAWEVEWTILMSLLFANVLLVAGPLWTELPSTATPEDVRKRRQARKLIFALGCVLPMFTSVLVTKKFIEASVRELGLSRENVSLILDEENFKTAQMIAHQLKLPLFDCALGNEHQQHVIHGVNLLWHGVGTNTLIESPLNTSTNAASQDKNLPHYVRFELRTAGIQVLQLANIKHKPVPGATGCLPVATTVFFDTFADKPNVLGASLISELEKNMVDYRSENLKVLAFSAKGFADAGIVSEPGDSNLALSMRRARSVEEALKPVIKELPQHQSISGLGATSFKSECQAELSRSTRQECRAPDRRVEVNMMLTRSMVLQ